MLLMPLVSADLQVKAERPSRFDFDVVADKYERWYETTEGTIYDRLEKKAINRYLPQNGKGKKLLEVGCGTGHWSRFFCKRGFEVIDSLENSPFGIDVERREHFLGDVHCLDIVNVKLIMAE